MIEDFVINCRKGQSFVSQKFQRIFFYDGGFELCVRDLENIWKDGVLDNLKNVQGKRFKFGVCSVGVISKIIIGLICYFFLNQEFLDR